MLAGSGALHLEHDEVSARRGGGGAVTAADLHRASAGGGGAPSGAVIRAQRPRPECPGILLQAHLIHWASVRSGAIGPRPVGLVNKSPNTGPITTSGR